MTPVAYVLVIDKGDVAAALELLRRVCDPISTSMPHITVRYSTRRPSQQVIDEITHAAIDDLIITGPETFDSTPEEGIRTVVLGCESDSLEWRSHKPDFPDSYFHITVYDGVASEFAVSVLNVMKEFTWNLRLDAASARVVESAASLRRAGLSERAREILRSVAPSTQEDALDKMSDQTRLEVVRELCFFIHISPEVTPADSIQPRIVSESQEASDQPAFWSPDEIADLTGVPLQHSRRRTGSYLTPPEIAFEVSQTALDFLDSRKIRFLDPAIGPGIFFATLREAARMADRDIDESTGFEMNRPRAERTATRWRRAGLRIQHADFLTSTPADGPLWNLLVTNPPYIKHQRQPAIYASVRKRLSVDLDIDIDGRADAYILFVLNAHRFLEDGAIAAWLLPSDFFFTRSGMALREYFSQRVELLRVHTFDSSERLFDHARVTSTVVIYRKSEQRPSKVVFTGGVSIVKPDRTATVSSELLALSPRWTESGAAAEPRKSSSGLVQVGDFIRVQRGIATGANSRFVLADEDLVRLEVRDRWIRPLIPRSRFLNSDQILADSTGLPEVRPRLWLIDTDESLAAIRRSSPVFADYLESIRREFGNRTLLRERQPFYRQDRRLPPPIVAANMAPGANVGRRFFRNHSRAVALNNYVCIYPREDRVSPEEAFSWLQMNEQHILASVGRMYSANLVKLEPGDLRSARIPPPG